MVSFLFDIIAGWASARHFTLRFFWWAKAHPTITLYGISFCKKFCIFDRLQAVFFSLFFTQYFFPFFRQAIFLISTCWFIGNGHFNQFEFYRRLNITGSKMFSL